MNVKVVARFFLYCALYLTQDAFRRCMRSFAHGHLHRPGVKAADILKYLRSEFFGKFHAQPLHGDDIGAVCGDGEEGSFRLLRSQFAQCALGACVFKVVAKISDARCGVFHDCIIELKAVFAGNIVRMPFIAQSGEDFRNIFLPELPYGGQTFGRRVDVRNIEHALNGVWIIGIQRVDRFATLANPEIPSVPCLHGRAGGSVRSL